VFDYYDQPQVGQTAVIFYHFGQFWGLSQKNKPDYLFDFICKFKTSLLNFTIRPRVAPSVPTEFRD
jgi:hypothetical protein